MRIGSRFRREVEETRGETCEQQRKAFRVAGRARALPDRYSFVAR